MTTKRNLILENDRLRAEVSYLRGQLATSQTVPEQTVAHIRDIIADTLKLTHPDIPTPEAPESFGEPAESVYDYVDWTDQMAPLRASDEERAAIFDELDRDA